MKIGKIIRKLRVNAAFLYHFHRLSGSRAAATNTGEPPLWHADAGISPAVSGRVLTFAACDSVYFFHFGARFLQSFAACNPYAPVHFHVYDKSDEVLSQLERMRKTMPGLGFSSGTAGLSAAIARDANIAFCSIRFVLLDIVQQRYRLPVFCLDADTVVRRDLSPLFDELSAFDLAFHSRFDRRDLTSKLLAGTLFVNHNDAGRFFASRTASVLRAFLEAGILTEKLDQLVLYRMFRETLRSQPLTRFRHLGFPEIDLSLGEEGWIWYPKGGKAELFSRNAEEIRQPAP